MLFRNVGNCIPLYTPLYRTRFLAQTFVVAHSLYSLFTPALLTEFLRLINMKIQTSINAFQYSNYHILLLSRNVKEPLKD
jgi:hypothetical protein